MEEAEELCDRVGIFVNGNFQCLGTPKEVYTSEKKTMLEFT